MTLISVPPTDGLEDRPIQQEPTADLGIEIVVEDGSLLHGEPKDAIGEIEKSMRQLQEEIVAFPWLEHLHEDKQSKKPITKRPLKEVAAKYANFFETAQHLERFADVAIRFRTVRQDVHLFCQVFPGEVSQGDFFKFRLETFSMMIDWSKSKVLRRCKRRESAKYSLHVVGGLAAGAGIIAATPLALGAIGFGATGVAAGSVAASAQSLVYGGATTGVFSVLQSVGAAGLGTSTIVGVPAATTGLATMRANANYSYQDVVNLLDDASVHQEPLPAVVPFSWVKAVA